MRPYLVMSLIGWEVGIQKHPDSPVLFIHCQDVKKVPQLSGVMSWIKTPQPVGAPKIPVLGASTVAHTSQGSPSMDVLPPDEDVESVGCGVRGMYAILIRISSELRTMTDDDGSGMSLYVGGS